MMCRMKQHFVLLLIPRTRMHQFRLRRRPRLLYTLDFVLGTQTKNWKTNHQLQLRNARGYSDFCYRPAWLLESFIPLYSSFKFGLSFGFLRLGGNRSFWFGCFGGFGWNRGLLLLSGWFGILGCLCVCFISLGNSNGILFLCLSQLGFMLYFNLPLRAKQGLSFPPSLYRLCLKKMFGFQPTPVIYITCSLDPNFHFYLAPWTWLGSWVEIGRSYCLPLYLRNILFISHPPPIMEIGFLSPT